MAYFQTEKYDSFGTFKILKIKPRARTYVSS